MHLQLHEKLLKKPSKWWQWLETLVITMGLIALCVWMNPDDPLTLNASFPWIVFGPILIALRYGTLSGMTSVIIIAFSIYYFYPDHFFESTTIRLFLLGNIFITVLCGEWYLAWEGNKLELYRINEYALRRLKNLNRAYYLLKRSHEELEQIVITQPMTIRNAIQSIKKLLIEAKGEISSTTATHFLKLLSRYTGIEKVQLFLANEGKINTKPFSYLDNEEELILNDPLIEEAIKCPGLFHIGEYDFETIKNSKYLVALSLRDNENRVLGLLTVKELSFWGANQSNLKALNIITMSFSYQLWVTKFAKKIIEVYPDCPPEFGEELYQLLDLRKKVFVKIIMAVFIIDISTRTDEIFRLLIQKQRSIDSFWRHKPNKNKEYLFILMPFSAKNAIEGFRNRFTAILKENDGIMLNQSEVHLRHIELFSDNPNENIKELINYANQV